MFGVILAKRQGLRCWNDFNRQIDLGETPTLPIMHGALILVAAALLIVPGFFSDFCGILLLFPIVRRIFIEHAILKFDKYRKNANRSNQNNFNNDNDNVLDID
jgi:UPF0716 family protein affecting phage T7 exclusion